jgi:hypothetical protein
VPARQADHEYALWVEGSATYVGFAAAVHAGLLTEAEAAQELADGAPTCRCRAAVVYERQIGGDAEYAVAAQAVRELVARSGPAACWPSAARWGRGIAWETAFEQAHGLSLDEFYDALG